MKILLVTPAPARSRYGNRITALRWARLLTELGHQVQIKQTYEAEPGDLLVALHAQRSHDSIINFHRQQPASPIIVALTGTDLYRDLPRSRRAQQSLDLATRIVALQPSALDELRPEWRAKTRIVYQSVAPPTSKRAAAKAKPRSANSPRHSFDVCVIGHLRAVKDPFRTALAARLLPAGSRVRVLHLGGAMTEAMAERAEREMLLNKRYRWLGEQSPGRVRQVLAQSQLCVLSSRLEGGANVISEAIVNGVPVIASRIAGTVGLLGADYPGYFPVGDTRVLAALLERAESDEQFLADLRRHCAQLAPLFRPARERQSWAELLQELTTLPD